MKTRNLSIGYPKRVVASGINISLEAGKLSCLIGENGVGKSTLLRTLAGFQKPLAGELLVDGVELKDIPKRELAKKIAVVLTDKPDVQNTTVQELVSMGRMPYTGFFGRLSKEDEALAVLFNIMEESPSDVNVIERIIGVYENKSDYHSISELLYSVNDETLYSKYSIYLLKLIAASLIYEENKIDSDKIISTAKSSSIISDFTHLGFFAASIQYPFS